MLQHMNEESKKLRHDRHTVSLLTDHMVFAPKYQGKILRKEFPHLKEFCDEHLWAPSCYHGSVGNGWEVVEKYISGQDTHHAKSDMFRPRS